MAKRRKNSPMDSFQPDIDAGLNWAAIAAKRVKSLKELKQLTAEINQLEKDGNTQSEEYNQLLVDRLNKIKEYSLYEDEINDLRDDSNQSLSDGAELLTAHVDLAASLAKQLETTKQTTKDLFKTTEIVHGSLRAVGATAMSYAETSHETNDTSGIQYEILKSINGVLSEVSQNAADMASHFDEVGLRAFDLDSVLSGSASIQEKHVKLSNLLQIIEEHKAQLGEEQYQFAVDSLEVARDQLDIFKQQADVIESAQKVGEKTVEHLSAGFDKVRSVIENVPGGEFLLKKLNFDGFASSVQEKVGGAMSEVFLNGASAGGGMFKSLVAGVKSFGMALFTGPQAIIFGIIAAGALLVKMFMDADSAVSDLGKELGVSKGEAAGLYDTAVDISNGMNLVGVNAEEVGKVIGEMNEDFPGITQALVAGNEHAKEFIQSASTLHEAFGLSIEEINNLSAMSIMTGKSMEELATTAGRMGEKTIGTKEAMKALATIPKSVTVAFKGTVDQLAKAAIKAKALGTDLGKVASIGDEMLDIESSLQKEMEARVITGKNINLDRARELALNGDIAGLQDELLNQMGSLSDFQSMNRLGQQAMADAMGMSVDEMTEMLAKAEELKTIGMDQEKLNDLMNEGYESMNKEVEKLRAQGKQSAADALQKLAKEKESATIQEKFSNILTKVQQTMMKLVTPLLEVVDGMFNATEEASGLHGMLGGVGKVLSVIGKVVASVIGPAFDLLIRPLKLVWNLVDGLVQMFTGDFQGGLKTIGEGVFDFLFAPFKFVIDMVTGLIDSLFGTSLKDSVGGFIDSVKESVGTLFSVFGAVFDGIMSAFSPIIDILSSAFSVIGDAFGSIFSSSDAEDGQESTLTFAESIKSFAQTLVPILTDVGKLVGTVLAAPLKLIANLVGAIVKLFTGDFSGALKQIGDSILEYVLTPFNFFTSLFDTIGEKFTWVRDLFSGFGEIIMSIGSAVYEFLVTPFEKVAGFAKGVGGMLSSVVGAIGGIFGGDDDESNEKNATQLQGKSDKVESATSSQTTTGAVSGAASGGVAKTQGLAIVGEQGPEIVTLPQSAQIANSAVTQQASSAVKGLMSSNPATQQDSQKLDQIINLLSQINSQVSTPANITIGGKVIREMNTILTMKKNATLGLDNQYGATI